MKALASQVEDDGSELHSVTGVIGASVSGVFLWILGVLNLVVLIGIIRVFNKMRHGSYDEKELEQQLNKRGFMNRFLGGITRSVTKPWHIYPIGVLFGLGFDTATEVGLLVLAGGAAVLNLPFHAILVLPILFAAGMCLMDTVDGVFMNAAYGWAFATGPKYLLQHHDHLARRRRRPHHRNHRTHRRTGRSGQHPKRPLVTISELPLDYAGYGIVVLFVFAWLTALTV